MLPKVIFSKSPASFALPCHGRKAVRRARCLPCRMELQSEASAERTREERERTLKLQKVSISYRQEISEKNDSKLQFDKLQQSERDLVHEQNCRFFGDFVARPAVLDEEYWTAAWLRAESHWEDRPNDRYAENYKRKFADQEYNALKRHCKGYNGQSHTCIVAVRKEDKNVKRTIIKSVVGTLDLSIRYLLQGESFPGERVEAPVFCSIEGKENRYGYVANLCVAKSARRKGIAINMLKFAIQSAKSKAGVEQIYVHVHSYNTAAQKLYQKLGFRIVEAASPKLQEQKMYLLCIKT